MNDDQSGHGRATLSMRPGMHDARGHLLRALRERDEGGLAHHVCVRHGFIVTERLGQAVGDECPRTIPSPANPDAEMIAADFEDPSMAEQLCREVNDAYYKECEGF